MSSLWGAIESFTIIVAISEKAIVIGVILQLLQAKATHLYSITLDIAVFKPFKTVLKRHLQKCLIDKAVTSFIARMILCVRTSLNA